MSLPSGEIRESFLRFFAERGHRRLASAPLVPDSDPTLMFVNAGMVPFKRVFLGEEARDYTRATTSQKCMRVSGKHNDLENVGRTPRHHTFFEMLGNFSFGDYFKAEAIEFAWALLTEKRRLLGRTTSSCRSFEEDDEAYDIWRDRIGLPESKLYRLDEKENFWSMGDTGPCGPCSEIHFDWGALPEHPDDDPSSETGSLHGDLEPGLHAVQPRRRTGPMTPLPKPSIDTGRRASSAGRPCSREKRSTWESDSFTPLIARAGELTNIAPGSDAEEQDVSLARRRRPCARAHVPDRGRRPAEQRRPGLRPAPHPAPRLRATGSCSVRTRPSSMRVADKVIDRDAGSAYPELSERPPLVHHRSDQARGGALPRDAVEGAWTLLDGEIE